MDPPKARKDGRSSGLASKHIVQKPGLYTNLTGLLLSAPDHAAIAQDLSWNTESLMCKYTAYCPQHQRLCVKAARQHRVQVALKLPEMSRSLKRFPTAWKESANIQAYIHAVEASAGNVPAQEARASSPQTCRLHVARLTRNVNEDHIKEIFGTFGPVKSVELAIDRVVNLPRGFAYVEFEERADAERARMSMDGGQLDGNYLRLAHMSV